MAQGELPDVDALLLGGGRQQQVVQPLHQLTLLITERRGFQPLQLDGEGSRTAGSTMGSGLLAACVLSPGTALRSPAARVALFLIRRFGALVTGRLHRGRCYHHVQAIEHGAAHDDPGAIQGGANVQILRVIVTPGTATSRSATGGCRPGF